MPRVRGGSCQMDGAWHQTGHGEDAAVGFPAWDPGCRGLSGLTPVAASSFAQMELVLVPNASKKIRNRNISKREV